MRDQRQLLLPLKISATPQRRTGYHQHTMLWRCKDRLWTQQAQLRMDRICDPILYWADIVPIAEKIDPRTTVTCSMHYETQISFLCIRAIGLVMTIAWIRIKTGLPFGFVYYWGCALHVQFITNQVLHFIVFIVFRFRTNEIDIVLAMLRQAIYDARPLWFIQTSNPIITVSSKTSQSPLSFNFISQQTTTLSVAVKPESAETSHQPLEHHPCPFLHGS